MLRFIIPIITPDRRQSETLILSTNVDQISFETEFSIAICRLIGDKWLLKTLFLAIFDPCSSIVKSILDCRLSGVIMQIQNSYIVDQELLQKPAVMNLYCYHGLR